MTEEILLVLAMSTDAFFAALSYSAGKIKIPPVSSFIIIFISSAVLTLSMIASKSVGAFVPESLCRTMGAMILGIMGVTGFCQNGLKSLLRRHQGNGKLAFRCFNIGFVISVYLDETRADADKSKILSPKESLALAIALSVDSISGGFGAGLSGADISRVCLLSFIFGVLAVSAGGKLGNSIKSTNTDLSWISGIFLILLAVYKLFA